MKLYNHVYIFFLRLIKQRHLKSLNWNQNKIEKELPQYHRVPVKLRTLHNEVRSKSVPGTIK